MIDRFLDEATDFILNSGPVGKALLIIYTVGCIGIIADTIHLLFF